MERVNIVVIPVYRRPAFLAATLRCIERARGSERATYLFSLDRGFHPACRGVIETFAFRSRSTIVERSHDYAGTVFNVLEGYANGRRLAGPQDLVHLIESDVFVADDYFEFHEDAHDLDPSCLFVSACKNQNLARNGEDPKPRDPTTVYAHPSHQSIGVSFRPQMLDRVLVHAKPAYYEDPAGYCARELPCDLAAWHSSQDGLIYRVALKHGLYGIYPTDPRAFHAGFWSPTHRSGDTEPQGSWWIVCEQLLRMTQDQMNELADPKFRDIERCEMIRTRSRLRLV